MDFWWARGRIVYDKRMGFNFVPSETKVLQKFKTYVGQNSPAQSDLSGGIGLYELSVCGNLRFAAQVWMQGGWQCDGAIGLLAVFKHGNQSATYRKA
jgi:hypothetical protein